MSPDPIICLQSQADDLAKRTENKVFRDRVKANWLPDGKTFWYRVQTGPESHEFVLIGATNGSRKAAPSLKAPGLPEKEAAKTSALPPT